MQKFTFPFKPPMEDCKMTCMGENRCEVYIFDTICKNQTPEERQRIDAEFIRIYNDILTRHALQESAG